MEMRQVTLPFGLTQQGVCIPPAAENHRQRPVSPDYPWCLTYLGDAAVRKLRNTGVQEVSREIYNLIQ